MCLYNWMVAIMLMNFLLPSQGGQMIVISTFAAIFTQQAWNRLDLWILYTEML